MSDFMASPWWVTISGAGTGESVTDSWAEDRTRHRSGISDTYTSPDSLIGRTKTGRELDNALLTSTAVKEEGTPQ